MARSQISLSPELQRRAQKRAAELGISFAEYVRRLVDRDLGEQGGGEQPASLFDLGDSGGSDVSTGKARYLGEAFGASR